MHVRVVVKHPYITHTGLNPAEYTERSSIVTIYHDCEEIKIDWTGFLLLALVEVDRTLLLAVLVPIIILLLLNMLHP